MGRNDTVRSCVDCGLFVPDRDARGTGACMSDIHFINGRYWYKSVVCDHDGCGGWRPLRLDGRMEPELGCRFCGAPAGDISVEQEIFHCDTEEARRIFWCECTSCGSRGPVSDGRDEAIDAWESVASPFNAPCNEPATTTTLAYGFGLMGEGERSRNQGIYSSLEN